MNTDERRRFGIADGLILIAAVAAGLAFSKALAPDIEASRVWNALIRPEGGWSLEHAFGVTLELGVFLGIPFFAAWTPTSLIVQLTRPRTPWKRLRRQPGFVASLVATVVVVVTIAATATSDWLGIFSPGHSSPVRFLKPSVLGAILVGSGVLWSWVTMKLCGACRPSTAWTDRLGRLTGALWILVGAMSTAFFSMAMIG